MPEPRPDQIRERRWMSPLGELRVLAGIHGIMRLDFCDGRGAHAVAGTAGAPGTAPVGTAACDALLDAALAQLASYFAGARQHFDLALDLRGTPFQRAVWLALPGIPYGTTRTYHALAEQIGRPLAVRATGAANGANPISIIVPCHRLIGADGRLRGYGGGLDRKRALLELERRYSDARA